MLSKTQAEPSRKVKEGQEEISPNHVQAFSRDSVQSSNLPTDSQSQCHFANEGKGARSPNVGAKRAEKRNLIHEAFNAKLKQGEEPFDLQRLKNMRVRMPTRVSTGVRDYRYF